MKRPSSTAAPRSCAAWRISWAVLLLFVAARAEIDSHTPVFADERTDHFERHIRPILVAKCLKCHGEKKQEGNLRLDTSAAMLQGGDSGPSIVSGQPAESLLLAAIKYDGLEMPPTGRLSAREVEQFERWIAGGASWPADAGPLREAPGQIAPEDRNWWAFQPLVKPPVPPAAADDWSRHEIDRFVRARQAAAGLTPAPPAEPATLVRRLYFDLIGLPPSTADIDRFTAHPTDPAWEELVDRLLADPRYGEHWGRYWLDIVRYAESDGWNQDAFRPHLWRYRDYVVRSLNIDRPYPQFILQQLAGDEIPTDDPEHLAAVGFLRLGTYEYNQRDARAHWNDIMNEITDVTADVFLGLGMACARCHDHKFDPLPQVDYFKLRAYFEPLLWRDDVSAATPAERSAYQDRLAAWEAATREVRQRIDVLVKPYHERKWQSTVAKFPLEIQACFHKPRDQRTSWEQQMTYLVERQFEEEGGGPLKSLSKEDAQRLKSLQEELAAFDSLQPLTPDTLMTVADFEGPASPTTIPDQTEASPIEPGVLTVLSEQPIGEPPPIVPSSRGTGRRTALARWLGRSDHPLTARVLVNRVWQEHFGQGLVSTANDFGKLGQPPTHPELLDWLAATFVEDGWSIKRLHKRILLSATWRQAATHPRAAEFQTIDPGDNLLWRARIRRLKAEQIRDALLALSGELDATIGGPSVEPATPRRSLYVRRLRNSLDPFLQSFDAANGLKSVAQRDATTTPTQSLLLINGEFTLAQARHWSARLTADGDRAANDLLTDAFRAAWGRSPSDAELAAAVTFTTSALDASPARLDPARLADFCHVLLNSNPFLFVE